MVDFIWYNLLFAFLVMALDCWLKYSKRFQFFRYALLLVPLFALLAFSQQVGWFSNLTTVVPTVTLPAVVVTNPEILESGNWFFILSAGYIVISILLLGYYSIAFWQAYNNGQRTGQKAHKWELFQTNEPASYSFLNRVFLAKADQSQPIILMHEEEHLRQFHSLDVIYANCITALFWINPLVWRWKQLIVHNHEFLVDETLIQREKVEVQEYVHLMLDRVLSTNHFTTRNYFSIKSFISKRINMVQKTEKQSWTKTVTIALSLCISLGYLASCKKNSVANKLPQSGIAAATTDPIYEEVDVQPEFKGGVKAMYAYIGQEVKYPKACEKDGVEGMVMVAFVIDKQGKITDVTVKKQVHELLDQEAVRVISGMPDWEPGKKDGKPVSVRFHLPLRFKLKAE